MTKFSHKLIAIFAFGALSLGYGLIEKRRVTNNIFAIIDQEVSS